MRVSFTFLCVLLVLGVPASLQAQAPWKAQVAAGLTWGETPRPFVEVGWFYQAIPMPPPEFYDLGTRFSWDPEGWTASVGARHKLYGSPWASTDQEVLVGVRSPEAGAWGLLLSGRFGGGLPWNGVDTGHPPVSTDLAWVWSVGWRWGVWEPETRVGLSLGLGGTR